MFCRSFPIGVRLIGGVTVVASLVILVPMYSVITTVALAIAMLLMLFVLAGWKGLAALFLASALLYQLPIPGLQKQLQTLATHITSRASSADPDSKRGELLNVAFITAMENRFVGAGHKSFPVAATEEVVKGYLESQGLKYNRSEYHYDVHGHSYWATSLVEKGAWVYWEGSCYFELEFGLLANISKFCRCSWTGGTWNQCTNQCWKYGFA